MRWTLLNGEDRHAENPDTFEIPSRKKREALRPGMHAKLCFEFHSASRVSGERMWVKVTECQAGRYAGTLANDPTATKALKFGDTIEFGPEHVINILAADH